MIAHTKIVAGCVAMALLAGPALASAACMVRSGPETAALIELYTSEGCSSCPPADEQLRRIRQAVDPTADVVALALHVNYWDSIGWKDPYAKVAFSDRQSWLVQRHNGTTVYTPHFFVSGNALGEWQSGLRRSVRQLNARPASADIQIAASLSSPSTLAINADVMSRDASRSAALYLAVAESGLSSKVTRGENSGSTLAHDHVVREWIGPIQLRDGVAHEQRTVTLPSAWDRAQLEVVGFVEDESSGVVLQAVSAQQCARS
jgi:hypothetical protein